MAALDLAVQPCLFAVLLSLIVLLPFFEQSMRGVVMRKVFSRIFSVLWVVRLWCAVTWMQLFDKLAVRFWSVLTLGVVLRAFLYTVTILHQPGVLLISVVL